MITFGGRTILLDIEGTTSSVSYVYDVLFPFARRQLLGFLQAEWETPAVQAACETVAQDAGWPSFSAWHEQTLGPYPGGTERALLDAAIDADGPALEPAQQLVAAELLRLMDADVKATGLKQMQGLIWQQGYDSGQLESHVYDDVPPALQRWHAAGCELRIYSSGSVAAQKVFFANTRFGDLAPLFSGHYDTTTGPKKDAQSYKLIAQDIGCPPEQVLFLSDVVAELDAAASAGLQTALALRPGNAPQPEGHAHASFNTFDEIAFERA